MINGKVPTRVEDFNVGLVTKLPRPTLSDPSNQSMVMDVTGDLLCIAGKEHFYIVDISNPADPQNLGKITGNTTDLQFVRGIRAIGNYAFLCERDQNKVVTIDISNPRIP